MADISTYLKNDTIYGDLDRSITAVRDALKTASDPQVKTDLQQELQLREKAQKKFKDLFDKAQELGYGSQDINSESYGAVLESYVNLVKDGNPKVNEDELYDSIQKQGKQKGPINKKALGLGIGLGCASAYTLASGIVGLAGAGDLTTLFVTQAIPAVASAIGNVASFMWGISPTFALGSLAVTALAVPLVKMAVQKAWHAHKVNKAKKEAVVRAQNEDAHKKAIEGQQNRADKIKRHKTTAREQFIYGNGDISKANDLNSPTTTDSSGNPVQDPDLQDLFSAEDITKMQAEAFVARNGEAITKKVLEAYGKKRDADLLQKYASFFESSIDASGTTHPAKLGEKIFAGKTFQELLDANPDITSTDDAKKKAAIKIVQDAILSTKLSPAERQQYNEFLLNYGAIRGAMKNTGYNPASKNNAVNNLASISATADKLVETNTNGYGLEDYTAGAVNIGDKERNERILSILEQAQQMDPKQRTALRDQYRAQQFGA